MSYNIYHIELSLKISWNNLFLPREEWIQNKQVYNECKHKIFRASENNLKRNYKIS